MAVAKNIFYHRPDFLKKGRDSEMPDDGCFSKSGKLIHGYVYFGLRILVIFTLVFSSCTISHEKAFSRMENLEGFWKSTGSIDINFMWHKQNDTLLWGRVFSLSGTDTVFLEDYQLIKTFDSLWLQPDNDYHRRLSLKDATLSQIIFENAALTYPNRVIFEWESDSIVVFRKENIRGNRPIKFRLKQLPL